MDLVDHGATKDWVARDTPVPEVKIATRSETESFSRPAEVLLISVNDGTTLVISTRGAPTR